MTDKKSQKVAQIFSCEKCNYITSKRCDYNKHITTRKHLGTDGDLQTSSLDDSQNYVCECGKLYKHRQSLYSHKKTCTSVPVDSAHTFTTTTTTASAINTAPTKQPVQTNSSTPSTELVLELIKQNKELQNVVLEQNQMMLELSKTNSLVMNNSNNNTTNNTTNNQFNLNFFLNETCKDAINLSEFMKSIKLQLVDLENTARLGYVEGISRILIRALNDMDVDKRPIHCTDVKRETVYVKEQDNWEKENSDKDNLKRAVTFIADQNLNQIHEWKQQNPKWDDNKSHESEVLNKIYISALGGENPDEERKFMNKIIKNVIQEVVVDKTDGVAKLEIK
uniref:C2H2-type domain-containing protein n=1 Tax=viral metagenome TaxID=1070528 RepID=A0A6C0DPS3_9ZZZZ